MKSSRTKAR